MRRAKRRRDRSDGLEVLKPTHARILFACFMCARDTGHVPVDSVRRYLDFGSCDWVRTVFRQLSKMGFLAARKVRRKRVTYYYLASTLTLLAPDHDNRPALSSSP